jgi:hypothetical protein
VTSYPFNLDQEDRRAFVDGYAAAINGTARDVPSLLVCALKATVTLPDKTRFAYLVTFTSHRVLQFAFSTTMGTPFDSPQVKAFFASATINGIDTPYP